MLTACKQQLAIELRLCCFSTEGGVLILSKCSRALEEGDGRSGWTFQGNSQLRLAKAGSWCLTQKNINGSTAGLVDLVVSSGASAEASSSADDRHGPQNAIDRNTDTSWASEEFEEKDEYPVTLDINLGSFLCTSFSACMYLHACICMQLKRALRYLC